jgi:hypothetical protein
VRKIRIGLIPDPGFRYRSIQATLAKFTVPIRGNDFIGWLYHALAHRWKPEFLFVFIFTGYLDESGTHDGSPVTVMGGLLGRAEQWQRFQNGFDQAKKKHGFRIFHTKKFKRKSGDFKGWTNEQCLALIADLGELTGMGLTDGAAVSLHNDTYDQYYKGDGKPNKARLDSKYGLCFRMCLYHFMMEVMKRKHRKRVPQLHIVIEAGHRNSGDAERIFLEVKKEFEDAGINMLRTITKAAKDECDPLMMADFVAHSTFMIQTGARPEPPDLSAQRLPRGATGITHFESTPEGLANIREHVISMVRKPTIKSASS